MDMSNNTKCFWKYLKNKRKNNHNLPQQMTYDERTANSGPEICQLFSEYFKSVYVLEQSQDYNPHSNSIIEDYYLIEENEIMSVINNLECQKGPGPDGIPPTFIKNCRHNLVKPLHFIYNLSLSKCCFPILWKTYYCSP